MVQSKGKTKKTKVDKVEEVVEKKVVKLEKKTETINVVKTPKVNVLGEKLIYD